MTMMDTIVREGKTERRIRALDAGDIVQEIHGLEDERDALAARLAKIQHERDLLVATVRGGIVLAPCPTPKQWAEIQAMSLTLLEAIAANGATVSADDVINAQHDETGRTWRGPRSQLPRRYFEITSICCLDYPLCDCNSPPEPDDDWLCFQRPAQPKVTHER